MKMILAGIGFLILSSVAGAQTLTSKMQEKCQGTDRLSYAQASNDFSHVDAITYQQDAFCVGFIDGWADEIDHEVFYIDGKIYRAFFSKPFTSLQAEKIFMAYASAHPESLSEPATTTLIKALGALDFIEKDEIGTVRPKNDTSSDNRPKA
jgi:hypothetical protein